MMRTPAGADGGRFCRSCGFTHPQSVTDCPRWPAEMFGDEDSNDERDGSK